MKTKILAKLVEFYNIWIKDCVKYPVTSIKEKYIRNRIEPRYRTPVQSDVIYVNIHEWGGYPLTRKKKIKGINCFECGLLYQLNRFKQQSLLKKEISLSITISESEKYKFFSEVKQFCTNIYFVPNDGMDFSGYAYFYNLIKDQPNAYVILTNSSVNREQSDFLQSYISYMEKNPDIGILGISASSKYYHTFLRSNFNPHIQSFFLLTTISVLREIIDYNEDIFPGVGELNKHLLIRNGEVLLSKITLLLGYNLAVVYNSDVVKINYNNYSLPKGDLRKVVKNPNAITPINSLNSSFA